MKKKKCFVVIGFGPKTDFETGRILNLDRTFENLIKPVFDELGIECFRARELIHSGIIDVPMYEWLYNADIVVADISTLNPNAIYELGVRHALKPYSTIVIAEDQLKNPFDVNHVLIERYHHLGEDIGVSEATRFKQELKEKVQEILKNSQNDSPVYTFLNKLKPPEFSSESAGKIRKKNQDETQFSDVLEEAENAKNDSNFLLAVKLFSECLKFEPNNAFLKQRLALVTYKSQKPNPQKALLNAEKILSDLEPEITTDPETLGLSGAVQKRLYEITDNKKFLDKAISFYERGFYIQQDYYNGINLAFLLTLKALKTPERFQAIGYYLQSQEVREKVLQICKNLIKQANFSERGDRQWIYQTMAQAYLGLGYDDQVKKLIPKISNLSKGQFDLETFTEQNQKLIDILQKFLETHQYPPA